MDETHIEEAEPPGTLCSSQEDSDIAGRLRVTSTGARLLLSGGKGFHQLPTILRINDRFVYC